MRHSRLSSPSAGSPACGFLLLLLFRLKPGILCSRLNKIPYFFKLDPPRKHLRSPSFSCCQTLTSLSDTIVENDFIGHSKKNSTEQWPFLLDAFEFMLTLCALKDTCLTFEWRVNFDTSYCTFWVSQVPQQ